MFKYHFLVIGYVKKKNTFALLVCHIYSEYVILSSRTFRKRSENVAVRLSVPKWIKAIMKENAKVYFTQTRYVY